MSLRELQALIAGCVLALLIPLGAGAAEDDELRATIDRPAVVTVEPARAARSAEADQPPPHVVVYVTGFQPAHNGSVQAVVKAEAPDGTERELGRFGVFPQAPFKSDTSGAQRYSFPFPKDLVGRAPVRLKIHLIPTRGQGEGAQLEVGRAEIQ